MRIQEAKLSSTIEIKVSAMEQTITFHSTVIDTEGDYRKEAEHYFGTTDLCLIEPLRHNGRTLGFHNSKAKVSVFFPAEDGLYEFANCQLKNLIILERECCVCIYHGEGRRINRRKTFRVPVSVPVEAQIGVHTGIDHVWLADLSVNGFRIKAPAETKAELKDLVRTQFSDPDEHTTITLQGVVVRIDETRGKELGCKMAKDIPSLQRYLNRLQQKRVRAKKEET